MWRDNNLRKVEPYNQNLNSDWIMMTGEEFYRFITSPEGKGRYFIRWDDLIIEAPEDQYRDWLCDMKHSAYLREHERGWATISLYSDLSQKDRTGEELISDPAIDVESQALTGISRDALFTALAQLDFQSFYLIYSSYLALCKKTEGELALEIGISQQAVHKRKKKILQELKFLVVKFEKSLQ